MHLPRPRRSKKKLHRHLGKLGDGPDKPTWDSTTSPGSCGCRVNSSFPDHAHGRTRSAPSNTQPERCAVATRYVESIFPEMQRLGSTWCSLRRQIVRQPFHLVVRHISRREWGKLNPKSVNPDTVTYKIDPLLLDLDSETAEHVRQYDPEIDGEQEDRHAKRHRQETAIESRIYSHQAVLWERRARFIQLLSDHIYEWHINDVDIVGAVLRGSPQKRHSPTALPDTTHTPEDVTTNVARNEVEEAIQYWNGLPSSATMIPTKSLSYMLHRQNEARVYVAKDLASNARDKALSNLFREQKRLVTLQRVTRMLLETPDGIQVLARFSDQLGEMCYSIAYGSDDTAAFNSTTASELLMFCNDLVLNLLSKDVVIKKQFWIFGFHLAVRCSAFSAARMYLAAALQSDGMDTSMDSWLEGPLNGILLSLEGSPQDFLTLAPELPLSQRRIEVFSLLTGCDSTGYRSAFSIHNMMQTIKAADHAAFRLYIQILGELGALRTLWHTYQQLPQIIQTESPDDCGELWTEQYVDVLCRVHRNVARGRLSITSHNYKTVTGNFIDDCQLDLQGIENNLTMAAKPDRETESYDLNLFSPKAEAILEAFKNPDMKRAMAMFHEILERETVEESRNAQDT